MKADINDYCGRCIHAVTSLEFGTYCGLTEAAPDLANGCRDLVIDPKKEAALRDSMARRKEFFDKTENQTPLEDTEVIDERGEFRWRGFIGAVLVGLLLLLKYLDRLS